MPDIYDQLLDQQPASPAAPQPALQPAAPTFDVYDRILDGQQAQSKAALQGVLDQAARIAPEKAATALELSKSSGLPVSVVERNFDEVARREQIKRMQGLLAKSPVLSRQMLDPNFAKLAQNDIEPLTGIEEVAGFFKNSGRAFVGGAFDASAGVVGITQAGADLLSKFVTKPLAGAVLPVDVGGVIANDLSQYRRGIEAEAATWNPKATGIIESGWYSGLQSLSRNLAMLPLALLPGGQGAALTGMTAPVFGGEYGKARDKGLDVLQATTYGASQAAIEYATEKIPVSRLIGDLAKNASFGKILARQISAEIPGEQAATLLQDLNEWAVINTDKTFADYIDERPSAAVQTLIATIVGTAGQTTVMTGIDRAANRIAGRGQQASQAEDIAARLAELTKFSRAISLTSTSPETFQQFVEAATEDGPVQDVYLDAGLLMQSGIAEQLAAISPSVAEQIQEAAATGGSVRIPVAEYAARIAPTELADGLLDHLKVDPDGMSRIEAGEFLQGQMEALQKEVGDTLTQGAEADAHRASVEVVRNTIRDELNAVNRFRPDVNEAYATLQGEFFGSLAQRIGLTPEQLFEKYRLKVAGSGAGGVQFDQAQPERDLVVTHNLTSGNLLHALKMGGIAVPSLAVTKKDSPLSGFGEITLIGNESMADPKGYASTKVYGADIYSPRYPSVERELDKKAHAALLKKLGPMAERMGDDLPDSQDLERDGQRALENSIAVMGQFLADNGIEPSITMRVGIEDARMARMKEFGLDEYIGRTDAYGMLGDPQFIDGAVAEQIAAYEDSGTADRRKALIDKLRNDPETREDFARHTAQEIVADARLRARPQADTYKTRMALEKQIADAGMGASFQKYISDSLGEITKSERIYQGFSSTGKRKYIPHTLENVVKILKKDLRGGENFNYGVGSLRAKFTPQFKSVAEIRKNKGRLVSAEQFEQVKKDIDAEFTAVASAMGGDLSLDTVIAILEDAPKLGLERAAKSYAVELTDDAKQKAAEFLNKLRDLPTVYFEAKILRDVSLAEFSGAVVPDNVGQDVLDALKSQGVTNIRTYKAGDEAGRAARIAEFNDLFFQFAGQRAQTADINALSTAQQRIEAGEDAEVVRQGTGWHKGADGKWRFEISDVDASLKKPYPNKGQRWGDVWKSQLPDGSTLGKMIDHPALFAAYPSLADIPVSAKKGGGASYSVQSRQIDLGEDVPMYDALSVLLHEIQHGIQTIEGFASGGTANAMTAEVTGIRREIVDAYGAFAEELQKLGVNTDDMPDLDALLIDPYSTIEDYIFAVPRDADNTNEVEWAAGHLLRTIEDSTLNPYEIYTRLAGEVEARNTQARANMTDAERRATPPSATADVADSDVIVMFNGKEMASAPVPANAAALNQQARGSYSPATNTISLLKAADLSTFLHESGHFFLEVIVDIAATAQGYDAAQLTEGERGVIRDVNALLKWFGVPDVMTWQNLSLDEKRAYHEQFAESFELYLTEGSAPSIELLPAFQRFRSWMLNVYQSIKDFLKRSPAAGKLSDDVRKVLDRMLATDEAIKTAEQARSLFPLFTSAQQAGMTEDEFAQYQALATDASATAQDELGTRGVRDMQWMAGARSRALRRLQKEAEALRKEVEIEARREVMSQPVYRAWQFLTSKITNEDRLPAVPKRKGDPDNVEPGYDSLFVAIAKLGGIDRAQLESEWGLDAKEKIAPPVFGKHVLRRNGGRTIDDMRAALVQYGYLSDATSGPDFDPREFEEKFFEELGGSPAYSVEADYDYLNARNVRPGDQVANADALLAGRLDRAALSAIGVPKEMAALLKTRRMTAADGLHPDIVAELFGFDSGDALVRTLAAAQDPKVEIEALTDLRMLEKHGDLAGPREIERAADAAVHNAVRARMIATELAALTKATGERRTMTEAARQFARQSIDRLMVRNIRASQYAAAQARAARAADKAMKAGDTQQAAVEKRNQLLNVELARAADNALTEVEKAVAYLKKFESEGARRAIDVDYLDQIDALLDRFDLRKGQSNKAIDKRTALASWIEARSNEGTEPDIPEWLKAEASREHYKNLTLEQFRGVVDAVRQIEHLGRLKQTLLTARDQRTLDAIVTELRGSIEAAADGRVVDNERRNTAISKASWAARGFMAAHRKLASIVREMDGMREGGPLWEYLVRPMNEAGEREATMRADAARRLHELAKPLLNDSEKMGGKGKHYPALGRSLNRGERIAIALNWGNEGNRQRLLDGRAWRADQVQPILDSLTAAEWQFVQGVWDFFESYRPQIAAKERRVSGKEPEWIEPSPFTVRMPDGQQMTVRGGYYPVKYDPAQSGEAEAHADAESAKQLMRAAYTAATTRRSFTKGRAEKVVNRPLLLSFDGIYQGANEVIHDLTHHEFLIDANRLLKRLDSPMRTGFGAEKVTAIKRAIEDIARGDTPAVHQGERILNHLRTGATITGLGWNLTTALLQPLGLTNSIVRVGAVWIARGLREFYGSPSHMAAKVEEAQAKSEFLRNRMRTMNREINDVQNRLESGKSDWRMAVDASFFILIQKLQATVDYPTWYGAYEKAVADPASIREDGTIDEVRAVAMADQAVIDAQGGGQIKDLAQIQRGSAAWKLFTNFYSYFSTTLNLAVERTKATNFRKAHDVMRLAGDFALLMVIPAIMGELLRAFMKGEDDEDEIVKSIIAGQISFLMGMFVGVRELTSAAQLVAGVGKPFGYQGPAGVRFFSEAQKLAQQIDQGSLDMALFKAANNTAGVLFHYPAGQVNRTVEGAAAMIEGRTANPMSLIVGPPPKD